MGLEELGTWLISKEKPKLSLPRGFLHSGHAVRLPPSPMHCLRFARGREFETRPPLSVE